MKILESIGQVRPTHSVLSKTHSDGCAGSGLYKRRRTDQDVPANARSLPNCATASAGTPWDSPAEGTGSARANGGEGRRSARRAPSPPQAQRGVHLLARCPAALALVLVHRQLALRLARAHPKQLSGRASTVASEETWYTERSPLAHIKGTPRMGTGVGGALEGRTIGNIKTRGLETCTGSLREVSCTW